METSEKPTESAEKPKPTEPAEKPVEVVYLVHVDGGRGGPLPTHPIDVERLIATGRYKRWAPPTPKPAAKEAAKPAEGQAAPAPAVEVEVTERSGIGGGADKTRPRWPQPKAVDRPKLDEGEE